jgi:hypothetical protein
MIETICQLPIEAVMGLSALIGALIYAGVNIYQKKQEDPETQINGFWIADTVWQSTTAGLIAGTAIGCSWTGILIAMVSGVGADKIANKFKIGKTEILNLVTLIGTWLQSKDK